MKEKLEVTYKAIKELESKLKLEKNYQGLNSVAIYLINLYFGMYHNVEEYKFFTHYKAVWLWTYLLHWLSVEDGEKQFGHKKFRFKQYLREAENDLIETKKNIFQMWKNNNLSNQLEKKEQILPNIIELYDACRLELYIEMLTDLIEKYPIFKQSEIKNFKEEIEYVK